MISFQNMTWTKHIFLQEFFYFWLQVKPNHRNPPHQSGPTPWRIFFLQASNAEIRVATSLATTASPARVPTTSAAWTAASTFRTHCTAATSAPTGCVLFRPKPPCPAPSQTPPSPWQRTTSHWWFPTTCLLSRRAPRPRSIQSRDSIYLWTNFISKQLISLGVCWPISFYQYLSSKHLRLF